MTSRAAHLIALAAGLEGVAVEHLPVVEHALGEGLAARVGAQVGREAERLQHRQVRLKHDKQQQEDTREGGSATTGLVCILSGRSRWVWMELGMNEGVVVIP